MHSVGGQTSALIVQDGFAAAHKPEALAGSRAHPKATVPVLGHVDHVGVDLLEFPLTKAVKPPRLLVGRGNDPQRTLPVLKNLDTRLVIQS